MRHPFVSCGLCERVHIEGLRFTCLHCCCFDVCERCEIHLPGQHAAGHVFDIVARPDFQWGGDYALPDETAVCIMGHKRRRAHHEGQEGTVCGWQAKTGRYALRLALEPRTIHVQAEDVQPLFTDEAALIAALQGTERRQNRQDEGQRRRTPDRPPTRGRRPRNDSRSLSPPARRRGRAPSRSPRQPLRLRSRSRPRPRHATIEDLRHRLDALLASLNRS